MGVINQLITREPHIVGNMDTAPLNTTSSDLSPSSSRSLADAPFFSSAKQTALWPFKARGRKNVGNMDAFYGHAMTILMNMMNVDRC